MRKLTVLVVILFGTSMFVQAQILHVPEDFINIQAAIDASQDGDSILVQEGVYFENLFIDHPLTMMSGYALDYDLSIVEQTIIDGDSLGSVIQVTGIPSGAVSLIGFTVQNGSGTLTHSADFFSDSVFYHGGGLHVQNVQEIILSNLIIKECDISGDHNSAGGIFARNSGLELRSCEVRDNEVHGGSGMGEGAGLYLEDCETHAFNCIISDNVSESIYGQGGGVMQRGGALTMEGCEIARNRSIDAGGIFVHQGNLNLYSCEINENYGRTTSALYLHGSFNDEYSIVMHSCTVEYNDSDARSAMTFISGQINIENCDIVDNDCGYDNGAITANNCELEIINTRVNRNVSLSSQSGRGGGLSMFRTNCELVEVEFTGNQVLTANGFGTGGAIYASQGLIDMLDVIMKDNVAERGAAMHFGEQTVRMENCLVVGNEGEKGGAIYSHGSHYNIQKSTIADNTAIDGAGFYSQTDTVQVINSIFWNESGPEFEMRDFMDYFAYLDIAYSTVRGGLDNIDNPDDATIVWHEGNLNVDPQFLDSENDDYSLELNSPLIDSGTPLFEFDGEEWVILQPSDYEGQAPDIGYFESSNATSLEELDNFKFSVWPNPAQDNIRLVATSGKLESVSLFDMQGRRLEHWTNQVGEMNVDHLATGTYVLQVVIDGLRSGRLLIKK